MLVWCQPSGMWSMRLCSPASRRSPVCQAAVVWTDYRGPVSLTLCCSYGRYLVGNATADITRIRHIQYIGLEQKLLYPSMHAVVLSCSSVQAAIVLHNLVVCLTDKAISCSPGS